MRRMSTSSQHWRCCCATPSSALVSFPTSRPPSRSCDSVVSTFAYHCMYLNRWLLLCRPRRDCTAWAQRRWRPWAAMPMPSTPSCFSKGCRVTPLLRSSRHGLCCSSCAKYSNLLLVSVSNAAIMRQVAEGSVWTDEYGNLHPVAKFGLSPYSSSSSTPRAPLEAYAGIHAFSLHSDWKVESQISLTSHFPAGMDNAFSGNSMASSFTNSNGRHSMPPSWNSAPIGEPRR